MRLRALTLGLALAFAPAACDDKKADDKEASAADKGDEGKDKEAADKDAAAAELAPPAQGTKRIDVAPAAPPEVTLLEAGTDPSEMRLDPKVGTAEGLNMTMNMEMSMSMGGQKVPPVVTPPLVTKMSTTVDAVEGDIIKSTVSVDSFEVADGPGSNPAMVETMRSMLKDFTSFKATIEMDRRGALKGGVVDVPQGLPDPMQQMINQMQQNFAQIQVPLPEEPVGVGGKWKATTTIDQSGMKLKQIVEYELLERDGNKCKLSARVTQELVDPNFSPPGMPGVKAKIKLFSGTGEGELELELDHVTPVKSNIDIKVRLGMDIEAMGQKQTQDMEMKMGMLMERA